MAGRPTDYSDDILTSARNYMDGGYQANSEVVPSIAGLARHLGHARCTMYEWGKAHDEFQDVLDDLLAQQELLALNFGLANKFNPAITKMVLANHGYSDRKEIDHSSRDGTMAPQRIEIVAAKSE